MDTNGQARVPSGHKPQNETDEDDGAAFAIVPLLIVNLLFLIPALDWLRMVLTHIPERLLDRTLVASLFGVLVAMKANPDGWRDMIRLAVGSLLFTAVAALVMLAIGMTLAATLSFDVQETYADELAWGPVIAVFLLYFPGQPALARLGLLPGFGRSSDEVEGLAERQAGEMPAWLPCETGHRLPAITLVLVGGAFVPVLIKLLAQTWPGSGLPLLESVGVSLLVMAAGMAGLFLARGTAWLAKLYITLLATGTMTALVIVIALLLPESAGQGVPGRGLFLHGLPIALALPFFLFAARLVARNKRGRRGPNDADPGEMGKGS